MELENFYLVPEIYYFFLLAEFCKPFSSFAIASSALVVTVQSIYFLKMLDFSTILQYSMFHFGCLYLLMTNLLYRVVIRRNFAVFDKFESPFLLNLGKTSLKIKKKLRTTIRKLRIIFISQVIACFINIFLGIYHWHSNGDRILAFMVVLHRYLHPDSIIYSFIYLILYVTFLMVIIPSVAIPLSYLYGLFHLKLRILLLADYIEKLKNQLKNLDEERLSKNLLYNIYVMMKLKLVVEKHLELLWWHKRICHSHQKEFLIYIFNGLFIGLSSVFAYFAPQIPFSLSIFLLMAFFVFAHSICDFGQDYLDASTDLAFELYDLDWYNWNVAAQKVYFMLLMQFTRGVSIPVVSSVHVVSNELFKELSRILYTVASFLYSVRK